MTSAAQRQHSLQRGFKHGVRMHSGRRLLDSTNDDAQGLWEYSNDKYHVNRGDKDSIANVVAIGAIKGMESLPHSTFIGGQLPTPLELAYMNQNDEGTSNKPFYNMTDLQLASLANVSYMFPKNKNMAARLHRSAPTHDFNLMERGPAFKWKTSYAKKPRPSPYQRWDISSVANPTSESKKAGDAEDLNPDGTRRVPPPTTQDVLEAFERLSRRILSNPTSISVNDADVKTIIRAGLDSTSLDAFIRTTSIGRMPGMILLLPYLKGMIRGGLVTP